jgi:hypothetical protein
MPVTTCSRSLARLLRASKQGRNVGTYTQENPLGYEHTGPKVQQKHDFDHFLIEVTQFYTKFDISAENRTPQADSLMKHASAIKSSKFS